MRSDSAPIPTDCRKASRCFGTRMGSRTRCVLVMGLAWWIAASWFSTSAHARCGDSNRQMIWRFANAAELIVWDGRSQSELPDLNTSMSAEHTATPCTECRCPRPDQPRIPMESVLRDHVVSPVVLPSPVDFEALPRLGLGCFLVGDDRMLGRDLRVLERPPRSL